MNQVELEGILKRIPEARIGLLADGCVDIYWQADMRLSELSREVPHHPLPVVQERFSLGAGANVAANLADLGVKDLRFISPLGEDWRGMLMERLMQQIGVSTNYLVRSNQIWTPAYGKPIRCGISPVCYEDARIDFANRRPLPEAVEQCILEQLEDAAACCDLLVVCDQFDYGCITERVIQRINELGEQIPIIVDSRSRIERYRNVIIKPNEVEACACLQRPVGHPDDMQDVARQLEKRTERPVVITLGEAGALWCCQGQCMRVPAFQVEGPIDFVGAGDSFLAAFSVAMALHAQAELALTFGCLASSVTIRKLGMTGTASAEELIAALRRHQEVDA